MRYLKIISGVGRGERIRAVVLSKECDPKEIAAKWYINLERLRSVKVYLYQRSKINNQ